MNRNSRNIKRTPQRTTIRFAQDKPTSTEHLARNHTASATRPLRKLKQLLCQRGERSDGEACRTCESKCNFGIEYVERKEQEK